MSSASFEDTSNSCQLSTSLNSNESKHSCLSTKQESLTRMNLNSSSLVNTMSSKYYHLPGYSGKIPQESQMFGLTRSEMSRRVFQNPAIYTRPETLFSYRLDDNVRSEWDTRLKSFITDRIYTSDMRTSGYTGHVPTMYDKFGRTSQNLFLSALTDFSHNQNQEKNRRLLFEWQQQFNQGRINKENLPKNSLVRI
jgi:hypothetical protein